jgi:hypothetical protein
MRLFGLCGFDLLAGGASSWFLRPDVGALPGADATTIGFGGTWAGWGAWGAAVSVAMIRPRRKGSGFDVNLFV